MEHRKYAMIHYMKLICAVLTVCMFTNPLSQINEGANFVLVQIISKIAIPFFFLYVSFFFFKKINFSAGLSNDNNRKRLIQFLKHMAVLYVLWTIIYLPFIIMDRMHEGISLMNLLYFIRDFMFSGSYTHLWIIPAMMFAITLTYFLSMRFKQSELFAMAFSCYLIGMLINIYGSFLIDIPIISTLLSSYLNVFVSALNGLFFGFIFVLMGLRLSYQTIPIKPLESIIKGLLFTCLYVLEIIILNWLGYVQEQTQLYLSLIPLMYFLFLTLLQLPLKKETVHIRKMSTLIYLSQFYGIELFSKMALLNEHTLLNFICVIIFTCLISYAFIKAEKAVRKLKVFY